MWGRALKLGIVCIALGAVTTVAVAWGSALWTHVHHPIGVAIESHAGNENLGWFVHRWEKVSVVKIKSHWLSTSSVGGRTGLIIDGPVEPLLPRWATFLVRPEYGGPHKERILECRGWPALAMWCGEEATYVYEEGQSRPTRKSDLMHYGLRLPLGLYTYSDGTTLTSKRYLPLGILWGGFAIDTGTYASAWLTLLGIIWFASGGVGRFRLSRGRCAKCNYPIGVSPVCTECGTELPAPRSSARTPGCG